MPNLNKNREKFKQIREKSNNYSYNYKKKLYPYQKFIF